MYGAPLELIEYVNNLAPRPLPRVLAIDESKATRDCEGAMAFIAMDWDSR